MLRVEVRRLCDEYPRLLKYPTCDSDEALFDSFLEENPILRALDSTNLEVLESALKNLKDEEEHRLSKKSASKWIKNDDLEASILSDF